MTREEYDRKAADGSLTVGDVLRNTRYATPEQLAAATPRPAVGPDLAELVDAYPSVVEAARYIVDLLREREQAENEAAVDAWETLSTAEEQAAT